MTRATAPATAAAAPAAAATNGSGAGGDHYRSPGSASSVGGVITPAAAAAAAASRQREQQQQFFSLARGRLDTHDDGDCDLARPVRPSLSGRALLDTAGAGGASSSSLPRYYTPAPTASRGVHDPSAPAVGLNTLQADMLEVKKTYCVISACIMPLIPLPPQHTPPNHKRNQELHSWLPVEDFLSLECACRSLFLGGRHSPAYFPGLLRRW